MVFSILNEILRPINYGIDQVRSNSWYIFLFIISFYIVKNQFKKLRSRASGVTLGTSSTSNSTDQNITSKSRNQREEAMHQARLRQQEIFNQKAKEALEQQRELLKKKAALNDDDQPNKGDDSKLSTTKKYTTKSTIIKAKTTPSSGYNPMQPWSASAGGGTYRPSARANPRGGG